jgi:superfamily I DNA and/or RNA helicase
VSEQLQKFVESSIESWCKELLAKSQSRGQKQLQFKVNDRSTYLSLDLESSTGFNELFAGEQVQIVGVTEGERLLAKNPESKVLISENEKYLVSASRLLRVDKDLKLDSGLETLNLTLGLLKWSRPDGTEMVSPLLVIAVDLFNKGPEKIFVQVRDNATPVSNLALDLILDSDYGLQLPEFSQSSNIKNLTTWFKKVKEQVKSKGWEVIDSADHPAENPPFSICSLSFQLEAIYQDIRKNAGKLSESNLVQSIVAKFGDSPNLNNGEIFIEKDAVDFASAPEGNFDIFASDSSQRVCIDAARRGISFVMDGPPGTGKTQTITNILSNLLADGKSVLFVAEKATALDAVYDNLAQRELSQHVLRLQDGKNTRKTFANQLRDVVKYSEEKTSAREILNEKALSELKNLRTLLNQHSEILSEVHPGLQETYSNLIGLATNSRVIPLPILEETASALGTTQTYGLFQNAISFTQSLAKLWNPVDEKESSNWYRVDEDLSRDKVSSVQNNLENALLHLRIVLADVNSLKIEQIETLVQLVNSSKSSEQNVTFTIGNFGALVDESTQIAKVSSLETNQIDFENTYGIKANKKDILTTFLENPRFNDLYSACNDVDVDYLAQTSVNQRLTEINRQVELLEDLVRFSAKASSAVGHSGVLTWADARTVKEYLDGGDLTIRPSRHWFHPRRANVGELQKASDYLAPLIEKIAIAENALIKIYGTPSSIPNLQNLEIVFTKKSLLGRISSDYRKALQELNLESLQKITLTDSLELREIVNASRTAVIRIKAFLESEDLFKSFRLESLKEFRQLETAISTAITHLAFDSSTYNSYLQAKPDSTVFYENASQVADPELSRFIAAVTVLFEIQERNTEMNLKYLLGNTTIEKTLIGIKAFQSALVILRDHLDMIEEFVSGSDLNQVFDFVEASNSYRLNDLELSKTLKTIKSEAIRNFDRSQFLYVTKYVFPVLRTLENIRNLNIDILNGIQNFKKNQIADLNSGIDFTEIFMTKAPFIDKSTSVYSLLEIISELLQDKKSLQIREEFVETKARAANHGLEEIIRLAISRTVQSDNLVAFVKGMLAKLVVDEKFATSELLSTDFTRTIDDKVARFMELDDKLFVNSSRIVSKTLGRRSQSADAFAKTVVEDNAKKTRNLLSIENQISTIGQNILNIAPVVMASPLNVSRYLPAEIKFDYVIFDEASQMYPAFALASLYRANAAIIAGDENQMPPSKTIGSISSIIDDADDISEENEELENQGLVTKDYESLLDLAIVSPSFLRTSLLWHYRSRNEGLIAFSNHAFYGGRLYTFPSRTESPDNPSVRLEFVKDGIWIPGSKSNLTSFSGRSSGGTNPIEAIAIAKAVNAHAISYFNKNDEAYQKSLLVIAMGKSQQEEIERQIQALLKNNNKELSNFLSIDDPKQSFLIKNLETAQGYERDYVFVGFGYNSRTKADPQRVMTKFGPLSDEKGWRRLNVAITRAKHQMVVFSSFKSSNLPEGSRDSIEFIRQFLAYAEVGYAALGARTSASSEDFTDSPFEEEVLDYVRSLGYECRTQVGTAGYRIDIGVKHKLFKDVYMLAIECDGAMYHSSKVARDRDKIRQTVLENLGWTFHRIWGTKWYRYNEEEKIKLKEVLEQQVKLNPRGTFVEKVNMEAVAIEVSES